MNFFRQYIAPLAVVLIFLLALLAVSIRIFLPSDMAAPAPISTIDFKAIAPQVEPGIFGR
ncbi:hypothetical protein IQ255_25845 [Pleurocapsales cyanobacterium LEGE 10410]|nr:hypothetical protein [Pleurocapsales cyanobacterium LEGE 10410]